MEQKDMNKGRVRKFHNVGKLQKRTPAGLICANNFSELQAYEQMDFFWLEMEIIDEHATFVLQQEPMVFLFDSELGRLYGIFKAISVHDSLAKIQLVALEKTPALEGAELQRAAREFGFSLNKSLEILDTTQVSELMQLFRMKKASSSQMVPPPPPPQAFPHTGQIPLEFGEATRFYPGFTEFHRVDEYENMNEVEFSSRQFEGAPGHRSGILEPVPMSFNPATTMDSPRMISTGMKPVLCSAPEAFGATFTHPVASQRAPVPDPVGFPPRPHARASAAPAFNTSNNPFEGMFHQQAPVPSEMITTKMEYVHQPEAGNFKQGFREARELREDSAPVAAAAPGVKKKGSPRIQNSPRIQSSPGIQSSPRIRRVQGSETMLYYTDSYVKRNGAPREFSEKGKGKLKQMNNNNNTMIISSSKKNNNNGEKASVFSRVSKRSVFNRLDDEPQKQMNNKSGRKVSLVRENNKLTINDQTRPKPKPELEIESESLIESREPVDEHQLEPEQENSFIDFKRRSAHSSSCIKRENPSLSPGGDDNLQQQQQEPRAKKRRFIRPDGLGTGSPAEEQLLRLASEGNPSTGVELVA